ncbi:GGDEF domain-containing protein [Roseococcus sp. YIM B11640]|uniref:GGDEF domain-containing protein n=1 Tax=Roseococcus sp. YIM B11640 TaxID=3133973 RepID=UPI003C79CE30
MPAETLPKDTGPKDASLAFAHAAISSMLTHRLPPTPANYLVWFSYHEGSQPGLVPAMDGLLGTDGMLDQAAMAALHDRFFAAESESRALLDMSRRLDGAVREAVGAVSGARDAALRYGGSLESVSEAATDDDAGLRDVLMRLLQETREATRRSEAAARRLDETSRQTQALQAELSEARRLATTDPLTGLANRRRFDEALRAALAELPGRPAALVMIDVDHFKSVNDRHGHHVGDLVLRHLAAMLPVPSESLLAARFGGEEFALILQDHALSEAAHEAETLRARIAAAPVEAEGEVLRITVSMGLAWAEAGEAPARLAARADAALYAAKRGGRNRLLTDPALPEGGALWA